MTSKEAKAALKRAEEEVRRATAALSGMKKGKETRRRKRAADRVMATMRKNFEVEPGKPSMEGLARKLESKQGLILC
jgi:hypothetical protein